MANDPYWNNVPLLLHGDTTGDPNASSITAYLSGINASPELGTLYSGVSNGTYNGRSCYDLTANTSTTYVGVYGTPTAVFDGDFTLEFWVYFNSIGLSSNTLGASLAGVTNTYSGCYMYFSSAGAWTVVVRGNSLNSFTFSPSINTWHHIALVSSSGSQSLYIDGVRKTTGTVANNSSYTTCSGFRLGYTPSLANSGFNGYGGGIKLYKGFAKYSGASFTVPTWNASASSTPDTSSYARFLAGTGSCANVYSTTSQFGGACIRCDGSSYIELPASADWNFGTGDFTVECWVYRQASGVYQALVGQWNNTTDGAWGAYIGTSNDFCFFTRTGIDYAITAGTPLPLNTWVHCALSHINGVSYLYQDGYLRGVKFGMSAVNTGVSSTVLRLGRAVAVTDWATCLLDDVRVTKGTARYTATVNFTSAQNDLSATDPNWSSVVLGLTFDTDYTDVKSHTFTNSGCSINTTTKKFGAGSLYLDGASRLSTPTSSDFAFGTSDFTVEFWLYLPVAWATSQVGSSGVLGGAEASWIIYRNMSALTVVSFRINGVDYVSRSTPATATWQHWAIQRIGTTLMYFVDGALDISYNSVSTNITSPNPLYVGYAPTWSGYVNGYIDDLRITKGIARYAADRVLTPPTQAFPEGLTVVSGTVLDAAGVPCARTVNIHSRANGRLLGTATSDPTTGVFSIGSPELCYAVALDSTGSYNSIILDRLNPL